MVSTRLRPWIDFVFEPLRCIVEDDQVTIEFELGCSNSGNAPARGVLVEASLFNAGPNQDQRDRRFLRQPGRRGRADRAIPPLKRVAMRTKVVAPREHVQLFEIGGRQVFVPLIAFNALYRWSGGEGQSSASYLARPRHQGREAGAVPARPRPAHVPRASAPGCCPSGVRN